MLTVMNSLFLKKIYANVVYRHEQFMLLKQVKRVFRAHITVWHDGIYRNINKDARDLQF